MAKVFQELSKDILIGLFETGKIMLTGSSSRFEVHNWKMYSAYDANRNEYEKRKKFSQALWRLKKSRLIITKEKQNGTFVVELTEKGRRKVREFQLFDLEILIPKKWNGLWHVVVFDIPEKRRKGRDMLRSKLKALDFYKLQDSVWVFPYPCESEIEFIIELFHLYPYVNIIEAKTIKDDVRIKKYYHLF
jgi:DNA-binding transcriptional regulator PaaX